MNLCVKYEMIGHVAKVRILFHNLEYVVVVVFVQLASTNCQDTIPDF